MPVEPVEETAVGTNQRARVWKKYRSSSDLEVKIGPKRVGFQAEEIT